MAMCKVQPRSTESNQEKIQKVAGEEVGGGGFKLNRDHRIQV